LLILHLWSVINSFVEYVNNKNPFVEYIFLTRGRGNKNTPQNIVDLLQGAVSKSNKNAVAKDLQIGIAALHRYLKGIGEPTTATLEKLAKYFNVSVAYLRGEEGYNIPGVEVLHTPGLPSMVCSVCGAALEYETVPDSKYPDLAYSIKILPHKCVQH